MNNLIKIIAISLLLTSCKAQKETIYNPIVVKIKETSLYSGQVNWKKVNSKFIELTKGSDNIEGQKIGLQYLINSIGDKHATFRSPKDHSIIVSYTGEVKEKSNRDPKIINDVINDISAEFSYQLFENGIGYLKIVGIGPGNVKEQADFIRNGLLDLKADGVNKWIIDLRFNGGGNMGPMLSGLAPFFEEGFIAGAINNKDEIREYTIESGQLFNYGRLTCEMNTLPVINPDEKVAVLLSRYTISSGELVAIAFKGRDNTFFIGEETAGYTTGTGYDKINDELVLVISQDVFIDKHNIKYENKVGVDEHIEFQHSVELEKDNQIIRAIEWVSK